MHQSLRFLPAAVIALAVGTLAGCASTAEPIVLKTDAEPEHEFAVGQTFFVQAPRSMRGHRRSSNTGSHDTSDEANARNGLFEQMVRAELERRGWVTAVPDQAQHRVEFLWKANFRRSVTRMGYDTDVDFDSTAAMGVRIYSPQEKRWVWKSEGKFELARSLDEAAQRLIVAQLFEGFPLPPLTADVGKRPAPRSNE